MNKTLLVIAAVVLVGVAVGLMVKAVGQQQTVLNIMISQATPHAEVFIDGDYLGTLDAAGKMDRTLTNRPLGSTALSVKTPNHSAVIFFVHTKSTAYLQCVGEVNFRCVYSDRMKAPSEIEN